MKTLKWRIYCFIMMLACGSAVNAQSVKVDGLQGLGELHYHQLTSIKPKQNYHIFVRLPQDYKPTTHYPTLYILDGGSSFPVISSYYHQMNFINSVPKMILVGISYGVDGYDAKDPVNSNNRSRDYTAKSAEREYWGGAEDFQQVLAKQVIPLIESRYSADAKRRIIMGHSLGGQFVIYTAMKRPELFAAYIASNPALHRNLKTFTQAITHQKPVLLFVGAASEDNDRFKLPLNQWVRWQEQNKQPWQLKVEKLHGHDHMSSVPAAFRMGIKWFIAKQLLLLP